MFLFAWLGFFAFVNALPTPQFLESAATLAAIPTPNHILILTPQAQVQLDPSLKYSRQLVQNLVPVARIDSPKDQTVVYVPSENLVDTVPKSDHKLKQIENINITNIVSQAVTAANTAQATLESLQQQLSQGLEGFIPAGGQKIVENAAGVQPLTLGVIKETARIDSGQLYNVPRFPQFFSNIEVIHNPLSPLFAVQPYQTIRGRNLEQPDNKFAINAPPAIKDQNLNIPRTTDINHKQEIQLKSVKDEQERNTGFLSNSKLGAVKKYQTEKENKQQQSSPHFEHFLSSIDGSMGLLKEDKLKPKEEKEVIIEINEQQRKEESISFAEALPTGLAVSGVGGLSQSKPFGSAIVGKDGVAYSAPSGTAISGSSINGKNSP